MLLTQSLKNIFYPPLCLSCENWLVAQEEGMCLKCLYDLPKSTYGISNNNPVAQVLWGRIPLQYACSFLMFNKDNMTHDILHEIKYKGNKELATYLGEIFAIEILDQLKKNATDVIVPIPLHQKKKRQRGFNQAEAFGNGINKILKCQINTKSLTRKKHTSTQTKKGRSERWGNVRGVFECIDHALSNKNVLLVDDVITTGATLESAALAILDSKPKSLGIITLAYANS